MEQHNVSSSRVRRHIIIIILGVLLVGSTALNVYQYWIRPESTYMSINDKNHSNIHPILLSNDPGDKGGLHIFLDRGLVISANSDFNLSAWYHLWNPMPEEITENITFRIFGRHLYEEYSDTPLEERTVMLYKGRNETDASALAGIWTLTAPSGGGAYVYKVWSGTVNQNVSIAHYTLEFSVWIESGLMSLEWYSNSN